LCDCEVNQIRELIQVKNNIEKKKKKLKAAATGAKKKCQASHSLTRVSPELTVLEQLDWHGV